MCVVKLPHQMERGWDVSFFLCAAGLCRAWPWQPFVSHLPSPPPQSKAHILKEEESSEEESYGHSCVCFVKASLQAFTEYWSSWLLSREMQLILLHGWGDWIKKKKQLLSCPKLHSKTAVKTRNPWFTAVFVALKLCSVLISLRGMHSAIAWNMSSLMSLN